MATCQRDTYENYKTFQWNRDFEWAYEAFRSTTILNWNAIGGIWMAATDTWKNLPQY